MDASSLAISTGSAHTVDSQRRGSLPWVVRFTIDRKDLINLVKRVEGRQQKSTDGKPLLRLSALGARVFVEGVKITCGNEALVLEEGSCRVPRTLFLELLKSYKKKNLTISADDKVIRIESFSMPHDGYSKKVKPPAEFMEPPVTDTWVAQSSGEKPQPRVDAEGAADPIPPARGRRRPEGS